MKQPWSASLSLFDKYENKRAQISGDYRKALCWTERFGAATAVIGASMGISHADPAWPSGPFTWEQGQGAVHISAAQTGERPICVLTRVTGKFRGGGEAVRLERLPNGDYTLHGSSQQEGLGAQAYCFSASQIQGTNNSVWDVHDIVTGWVKSGSGSCEDAPVSRKVMPNGKWFSLISGMSGEFKGGGEYIQVNQSRSLEEHSEFSAHSCADDGYVRGWAMSFYVGDMSKVLFDGPEFVVNDGAQAQNSTPNSLPMAPVDSSICGFTFISGQFDGGGEYVEIRPLRGRWQLTAKASNSANDPTVFARAHCFRRDQSGRPKLRQ